MNSLFFGLGLNDAIGLVAAAFTTFSFLPQIFKTLQSKSAADLSYPMLSMTFTGVFLWLVYGLGSGAMPVIVANGVTLIIVGTMLAVKAYFDIRARHVCEQHAG